MNFLRTIIEEKDPARRAALLEGGRKVNETSNAALVALSKRCDVSMEDLLQAVKMEIIFTAEGLLLGDRYPGDPDDETRANKILEAIIRRRASTPIHERDPLTEAIFGRGTMIIQSAINAGVSRVAAEAAVIRLVYSGRYAPSPARSGDIVPIEIARKESETRKTARAKV